MPIRFFYRGDPAKSARYQSFARQRAAALLAGHHQRTAFPLPDDGLLRLERAGDTVKCFIDADAPALGYQFYGTEQTMFKTVPDPRVPGRYLPLGNWTWCAVKRRPGEIAFKPAPLLSSLRASERWPSGGPMDHLDRLAIRRVHQPDGMGVRTWRDPRDANRWLAAAWVEPTPYHGAYRLSGAAPALRQVADRGYDVPPTVFRGVAGSVQVPDTDWYRGACVRRVRSDRHGERAFVVAVDVAQRFHCYPLGVAGERLFPEHPSKAANVDPKYVKSRPAPLPDWVTRFSVGEHSPLTPQQHFDAIQPRWEFSPLGDKAASVQFERAAPFADAHFTSARYSEAGVKAFELQEDWPGVVEVRFDIEITGPAPEDFSFAVALKRAMHSRDDGRGYLATGYAGRNFPELPGGVKHNDLLILEHRYYLGAMFQPASAYEDADLGHVVSDRSLHVYQAPPMAAVAAVTREGEDVLKWLSAYVARRGRFDPFSAASRFQPTFDDLTDKPPQAAGVQMFSLHTAIHGMDLPTLTFCLGTSATLTGLCTAGFALLEDESLVQWSGPFCASASQLALFSLGKPEERAAVGHPQLKPALPVYLALEHPALDLSAMAAVDLRASADQRAFYPEFEDATDLIQTWRYRVWPYLHPNDHALTRLQFAVATVSPGIPGAAAIERRVLHATAFAHWHPAAADAIGQQNLYNSGLRANPELPDSYLITVPTLYTLFDANWHLRPGIRRVAADGAQPRRDGEGNMIVEPGDSDVTGYPLGLSLHARFAVAALWALNNPHSNVAASANGSYAAFAGPVAAATSTVATHPDIMQPHARLPASAAELEQVVLDVIRVRWGEKEAARDARATHIGQMNEAFGLALEPADYHLKLSVVDGALEIAPPTFAPGPIPRWRAHHPSEYDRQFFGDWYGGAAIFSPIAVGQVKTCYVNTSGGVHFPVTLPAINEVDLMNAPTPSTVALPTPRMDGVFAPLPWTEAETP